MTSPETNPSAAEATQICLEPMIWGHSDEVLRIEQASFGSDAWTQGQFWSELGAPEELKTYIVALDADRVVGYAGVQFIAPEAEILTVAVDSAMRGRGVGSQLVRALELQAGERGCALMHLEVEDSNASARALYLGLGYVESGERKDYYGRGRHAVLMRRDLDELMTRG